MKYNYEPSANLKLAAVFNKRVIEIGAYYLALFAALKLSDRLDTEEKAGQVNFLVREWERELDLNIPFNLKDSKKYFSILVINCSNIGIFTPEVY